MSAKSPAIFYASAAADYNESMSVERRIGLKDDEKLLMVARAAPVTIALPAIFVAILILSPFFFLTPLLRWQTLGEIIIGVLLFLGAFLVLRGFFKWWFTMLAVTDRRLVVILQKGLFERLVTELPFAKVHDVSYRVKGFFATVFRYGSLLIESSGGGAPIEMRRVRRPEALQSLIAELQEHSGRGAGDFGEMLQAVSRMSPRNLGLLRSEIDRSLRAADAGKIEETDSDE